ncbi:ankyrin repeat and SOCS box protein 3 isoform X1 [Daphnia magna]|uniref:ankyrin repeat and SOCS box protein 3 isoform X1 n=1 Tax=Daphnia magna TaxID=35525 RepID=UPI001E1BC14D|nr:ankyrin repeat and SOCS box protein 3 isoform X1 [Daphnia magna]
MNFDENYPDSSSSVALAARAGNLETLKWLVSHQGNSIESQDNRGWRPIHEAAYCDHAECLKFLLCHSNTNVNAYTFEGQTALWIAADNNSFDAAKILLEAGGHANLPNNEDVAPLHRAASKGFKEMTNLLISNGANVNLTDYGDYTPLHEAAIQGHFTVVEVLLSNGADKTVQDSHGRTPLFCGAQSHSCQVVQILLDKSPPSLINLRAHDGATTIMLAAQSGCLQCVQLLAELGANPNLKANDGVMAVHLAVIGNHTAVLKFLLGITDYTLIEQSCAVNLHNHTYHSISGFNYSSTDIESINIFVLAVTYGRWNLIGILIEEGLKPDFFAFPINFSTAGGKWFRALGYKWLTPLSFVMAYSPFGDESIEAVKLLIRKGSSGVIAIKNGFVPPLFALIAIATWDEDREQQVLALDFLVQECNVLRVTPKELGEVMHLALRFNPKAFQHILHLGYVPDDSIVMRAFRAVDTNQITAAHTFALSALNAAGFSTDFETKEVNTLKQLSRRTIRSALKFHKTCFSIPELNFPLPKSLVSYLCFSDVVF